MVEPVEGLVLVIGLLIVKKVLALIVKGLLLAQPMAPVMAIRPPVEVVVCTALVAVMLLIGSPSAIPVDPATVIFTPKAIDPLPAVVHPLRGVVPPTAPDRVKTPPVVREIAPVPLAEPSIVLANVMLLVPPLVKVAVELERITGLFSKIAAPTPEPVEMVQAPRPIVVLGERAVMLIAPVPVEVVVTEALVSICTPLAAATPPVPLMVMVPLTAVTVPPLK